jgi:hypothetical protein
MDTGAENLDQLWRNGAKSYTTVGGHNWTTYVYADTYYDWKWFFETVHYSFQAWDSIQITSGTWYWYNAYCNANYDA